MQPLRATGRWGRTAATLAILALVTGCASSSRPLQFLSGPDLVYPPAAKEAGIEGQVVVRYDVTVAGTVANARVLKSQPEGFFEEAALASLSQWRFRPRIEGGQAVPAPDRVSTLRFQLGENDDYAGF